MKYLSLFSGIGGFELGIQLAHEYLGNQPKVHAESSDVESRTLHWGDVPQKPICVGFAEIDKYASSIYQNHFPDHEPIGDITKVTAESLPDFDLLVGGFPCQAFSVAGKRLGFADTRGTLFFDIARILEAKHPRLLLLENVKGLTNHDGGNTFRTIIATLDELGYDLQWQVLNSKNHGVPQNRERVFIVGHLRGTRRPEVFPLGVGDGDPVQGNREGENAGTLTARYGDGNGRGTHIREVTGNRSQRKRVYEPDGLMATLSGADGKGGGREPKIQVGTLRTHKDGDPSFTVTSQDRHGVLLHQNMGHNIAERDTSVALRAGASANYQTYLEGMQIRRLTPVECERLQAFPDGWTALGKDGETVSDTQRYKCLGNAVTVNVIRDICVRLLA